ncbi:MAG: gliding motility-associated C-terminal domain-containing protein [Flavobacteriales bacterium]|nr:gliding motility-associated C-terminal domain-containing protein [Flavobacteriales bacterium]
MKLKYTIAILLATGLQVQAQQRWLNKAGGAGNDEAHDMARDAAGDLYITGYFSFGAQFGDESFTAVGSTDIFVAKVSGSTGEFIWAKAFGGAGADAGISISTVGSGGIAVTGFFEGQATFGSQQVTAMAGSQDIFVLRLDADGNVLWQRTGGGPDSDIPYGIATDLDGNIVTTGSFKGAANFSGQAMVSVIDPILEEPSYDIYILKYGPQGALQWGLQGAAEYEDRGMAIATGQDGTIFVAGQFSDTITFNQTYNNGMFNAGFLLRLAPDGTEQWLTRFGATVCLPRSMTVDNSGKIYMTGDFLGNMAVFGPQTVYASNPYQRKVFLAKFDGDGGADWIRTLGSDNQLSSQKVALDAAGAPYIAGDFKCSFSELAAQHGEGVFYSVGFRDIFTAKFSSDGARLWEHHIGGPRDDRAGGLALREVDRPIVAGGFQAQFNVPYVPQAFQINNEVNEVFNHINPSYLNYCGDPNYARFVSVVSSGQRDVLITEGHNPSRQPYDYFLRSGTQCDRDYLIPQINGGLQTLSVCDSALILLRTRTDRASRIGPIHTYDWSNGLAVDSFWVTASEVLTLQTSRLDGCRVFYDTIDVTVNPPAIPPLVSDDQGINSFAAPDAYPIFKCHPDSVTIWGENMQPDHTYRWVTSFGTFYTDTVHITHTAGMLRIAETSAGCTDTNKVFVSIDDFANFEPVDPHIIVYRPDGVMLTGDTMHVCRLDTFLVRPFDSLQVSGNGFSMPYMHYAWSETPYGLISLLPDISDAYYRNYSVLQSGGVTIQVTIVDGCNVQYPFYDLSRTFYLDMVDWSNDPHVSGPSDICPGDTVVLTATGGQEYYWTGPGVVPPGTGATVEVVLGGEYIVYSSILTEEGCYNLDTAEFSLPERLAPLISMIPFSGIICPYDSVLMTLPAGSGYQWIGPDGEVIGNAQSVYGQVAGPYYGTMNHPTGCALVSDGVELAEYTSPYIVAEPSLSLCEGQTITLEVFANDGSILQWGPPLTGGGYYQTVSDTGTYTVSATLCGFTETVSVTITEFNLPVQAIIVGQDSVCHGETILLTVIPAYPFMEWSDGSQSQYLQVDQGGNYSVSIMDDSGCEAVSNVVTPYFRPALPVPAGLDTTVCHGDTLVLPAETQNGLHLLWSPTTTQPLWSTVSDSILIGPVTQQGSSAIAFTDSVCNSGAAFINYAPVVASGPPAIAGDNILCLGDTLNLFVTDTGGAIINWTFPDGETHVGSSINMPVPLEGEYILSIDPLVCSVVDSTFAVVVNVPMEIPVLTSSLHFCITDSVILSVENVTDAVWHPMGSEGNSFHIQEEGLSEIFVTGIDTNGCSVTTDTVMVTGHAPPLAPMVSDTIFCQWQEVLIPFEQTGVSHSWQFEGDSVSTDSDTLFIAAIDSGGWVIVTPFDSLCIGMPDSFHITVIPFPSLEGIDDSLLVCYHGPLVLGVVGTGEATVEWTLPDGLAVMSDSLLMDIPQEGIHVISAANGACSVTDTFLVTIVPQLPVEVTADVPLFLCPNTSLELSGPDGFSSYHWMPDSVAGALLTVSEEGQYLLLALDSVGCVHLSDTVLVTAVPAPMLPVGLSDTLVCEGMGLTFSTDSISVLHHWTVDGTLAGNTPVLEVEALMQETLVSLSVSDTVTGCMSDTLEITVGIITLPETPAVIISSPICEGDMAMLEATEYPETDYLWIGPFGEVGEGASVAFGPVGTVDAGSYILQYSVLHCSAETAPVLLEVIERPDAPSIVGKSVICEGDTLRLVLQHFQEVELFWTDPLPGAEHAPELEIPDIQLWQGGQFGAYASNEGCLGDTTWTEVNVSAPPLLDLGVDSTICDDAPLLLEVDEDIFSAVGWSTGEQTYQILIVESGAYHVTAWTDGGCVLSDSLAVDVIDCDPMEATVFTPNGDGVNDSFTLYTRGVVEQLVTIYNRWGHVVSVLRTVDDSWDGTHHLTLQLEPAGTYYYVGEVTLMSGTIAQKKNWLQLMR